MAANSNAVLRLVDMQNGMVLQKLKALASIGCLQGVRQVETEVRTLKFDDTGMFLLVGALPRPSLLNFNH